MIHFFRNIRRNLLEKNNFKKYLLYTIGEVLIIMIGILIALQINNWNENQKISITEMEILKEIKSNLKTDLTDIQWDIDYLNKHKNANQIVLKSLNASDNYSDTLNLYYANIYYSIPLLIINTSAFENLKSIGFNIIKNDSLRINITELYSNKYNYLEKLEDLYFSNYDANILYPQVISNIITDTLFISAKPINLSELAMNNKFKETIRGNINWIRLVTNVYVNTEEDIVTIINQIDNEIKRRTD